jgi:hypothetical protein
MSESEFRAYEKSARASGDYMKVNTPYFVNLAMKPVEVEVDSDFKNKDGSVRKVKQYKIGVVNKEGLAETVTVTGKVYLDILAQIDALDALKKLVPKIPLFQYVKVKV